MNTGTTKSWCSQTRPEVERGGAEPVAQDVQHRADPGLAAPDPGHEPVEHVAEPVDDQRRDQQRQALLGDGEAGEHHREDRAHEGDHGRARCRPAPGGVGPDVEGVEVTPVAVDMAASLDAA